MSKSISRRDFAKATACGSLGTVAAACSSNEPEVAQAQLGPNLIAYRLYSVRENANGRSSSLAFSGFDTLLCMS